MHKILFGLTFAAMMANPALAQDYRRNFHECAKEIGLNLDVSYGPKIQAEGGRQLRRYWLQTDAQQAALNDCLVRKAVSHPSPPRTRSTVHGNR